MRILGGTVGGVAGQAFAARITQTYTPSGMTYRQLTRQVLSPPQQLAAAAVAALSGVLIAESVGRREDSLGRNLRAAGRWLHDVPEPFRKRVRQARHHRERDDRGEWLRTHSKPVRTSIGQ